MTFYHVCFPNCKCSNDSRFYYTRSFKSVLFIHNNNNNNNNNKRRKKMEAFTGTTRLILLGFFASHIVFTICLDSQAVLPLTWYPQIFIDLGQYEVTTFNDPLMGNARNLVWFQSLVILELVFQLPFFIMALYYLINITKSSSTTATTPTMLYPEHFRTACIAYGAHTSTTLIPILATFWSSDHNATTTERMILTALYFPYLAIPLWLLWTSAMCSSSSTTNIESKKSK